MIHIKIEFRHISSVNTSILSLLRISLNFNYNILTFVEQKM